MLYFIFNVSCPKYPSRYSGPRREVPDRGVDSKSFEDDRRPDGCRRAAAGASNGEMAAEEQNAEVEDVLDFEKLGAEEAGDESVPDMELSKKIFLLKATLPEYAAAVDQAALRAEIFAAVEEKEMAPLYERLVADYGFERDAAKLEAMASKNAEEVKACDDEKESALTNAGDMEVLDAVTRKARHYARIGDYEKSIEGFDAIMELPKVSTSKKIEATMAKLRVAFFHGVDEKVGETLEEAKKLVESGGDWDKRNRLKCYEALYLITIRDMEKAAALLLSCTQTFTATELCSYEDFILYCVVTNALHLGRVSFKKDILDSPDVLAVIRDMPVLSALANSLHSCDFATFLRAIVDLMPMLQGNPFFAGHAKFLGRELRIKAYTTFLEAYKSVRMASMAASFGVSIDFLDADLARFIASGRVPARIDRVDKVVETTRPNQKNAQFQQIVKRGDALLNRLQAFSRVVEA